MIRGILRAGLTGGLALVFVTSAQAKTFEVTKAGDSNPNGCGQGGCTLREATIAANSRNGADVIILESGRRYEMSIDGSGEDASATGDFDLTGPTTVRADGNQAATIDGNKLDKIFDAFDKARFERLDLVRSDFNTIEGDTGNVRVERSSISSGGGIGVRVDGADATIVRSRIADTSSNAVYQTGPGGVSVTGSQIREIMSTGISEYEAGGVSIERTAIRDTASNTVYESDVGDIKLVKADVSESGSTGFGEYDAGDVTIKDSALKDFGSNVVYESGDGNLAVAGSEVRQSNSTALGEYGTGNVRLTKTSVKNSTSNAIYESDAGSVALKRARLSDSGSTIVGEYGLGNVNLSRSSLEEGVSNGIYEADDGGVKLARSKVSRTGFVGVQETGTGPATLKRSSIMRSDSYGLFTDNGPVKVSDSTLEGHETGGLRVSSLANIDVEGSTIANNGNPAQNGAGILANGPLFISNSTIYGNRGDTGAGILVEGGSAELNAVTITRNRAETIGGGIYQMAGTVEVENSIVADNEAGMFGPDCYASSAFTSKGHNLLSDDDFCTGLGGGSDKVKGNAKTEALRDNGGPTETAAIAQSSPAVDNAGNSAPPRDQRGRKRDSKPDIGSYER